MPAISLYFVRHGQRIDQVDSTWADTSPCPQDPPLTAQGKMQARQTGWMIRDFAHESSSSSVSDSPCAFLSNETTLDPQQQQENGKWTVQRITPPDSPDHQSHQQATMQDNTASNNSNGEATASGLPGASEATRRSSTTGASKRKHHFAIVTSPFLRCSQTAIEIAIGMRMSGTNMTIGSVTTTTADNNCASTMNNVGAGTIEKDKDLVTISVESALAEWLSLEYVSEPVPDSIIVQRMQDFAMSRRDHEQYYGIDWKYQAKERQLPSWPETHEDMQARLERALQHIIESYTGPAAKDKDRDLSIVFVTHASPVNALLEVCLQSPVLVPVPNCSISRCRWTPSSAAGNDLLPADQESLDAVMRSRNVQTIAGESGRWLLDYQTYTAHLARDYRR